MNDEQIIEYCRKLVTTNLDQYTDTNPAIILSEIFSINEDKTNQILLEHCKGLKELLEKCIEILEQKNDKN